MTASQSKLAGNKTSNQKEGLEDNQTTVPSIHTKKSFICVTASSELQKKRIAFEAKNQAHEMLMNKLKLIDIEQKIEVAEIEEHSQISAFPTQVRLPVFLIPKLMMFNLLPIEFKNITEICDIQSKICRRLAEQYPRK
ncbi:hypothetical protein JTB14_010367 [Gonioctena quinquepunctata]|nr:hypothetical protein JTB14_010367 [Gonioctena quinquepunctata]